LLQLVGLDPTEYRNRYPRQLSGGQQQRVGLARALASDPDILLMDEPFGSLDAITRSRMQDELRSLHRSVGKTIVFVTHDVEEALRLGEQLPSLLMAVSYNQEPLPNSLLNLQMILFAAFLVLITLCVSSNISQ
jgi:osmoprotectant transport system ATP-binding protein